MVDAALDEWLNLLWFILVALVLLLQVTTWSTGRVLVLLVFVVISSTNACHYLRFFHGLLLVM